MQWNHTSDYIVDSHLLLTTLLPVALLLACLLLCCCRAISQSCCVRALLHVMAPAGNSAGDECTPSALATGVT